MADAPDDVWDYIGLHHDPMHLKRDDYRHWRTLRRPWWQRVIVWWLSNHYWKL
jgi:hypothetical protein